MGAGRLRIHATHSSKFGDRPRHPGASATRARKQGQGRASVHRTHVCVRLARIPQNNRGETNNARHCGRRHSGVSPACRKHAMTRLAASLKQAHQIAIEQPLTKHQAWAQAAPALGRGGSRRLQHPIITNTRHDHTDVVANTTNPRCAPTMQHRATSIERGYGTKAIRANRQPRQTPHKKSSQPSCAERLDRPTRP